MDTSKQIEKKKEKQAASVELLMRCVVRDKDGKVIYDSGQKPSKSYVDKFLIFVGAMFRGVSTDAVDITNVSSHFYWAIGVNAGEQFLADGGVGVDNRGIVVGTSSAAKTNTDYKLGSQFTEGTGAGQITHNAMTIQTAGIVGANVDLVIYRSFTNNTGADRIVREVGVYVRNAAAGILKTHMIIRDVLALAITVPDKCSLTVYDTLRTTV